jgi:signal transduction histidine kinase
MAVVNGADSAQILGNLLSNAFRHTVEGTVSIVAERHSATVGDSAGSLVIKVSARQCRECPMATQ